MAAPNSLARVALVVGPLVALGPFAIDMYLPALPVVASDLGASVQATQVTLTAFFLAFGACQLVYGPLSDRLGRKPPLHIGIGIFLLGSIGCLRAACSRAASARSSSRASFRGSARQR